MSVAQPILVAIVGGSGAGKTWLSRRIAAAFPGEVARISQDDFYRDRSHLPPARRDLVNYDQPAAIEWPLLRKVLSDFRAGQGTRAPQYEFSSHCRLGAIHDCPPAPLLLVEGLWLLSRRDIRNFFDLTIYVECPAQVRLERRLARDVAERGRNETEVRRKFHTEVAPMHNEHVAPQRQWAQLVLLDPISEADVQGVIARVRGLLEQKRTASDCWHEEIDRRAVA